MTWRLPAAAVVLSLSILLGWMWFSAVGAERVVAPPDHVGMLGPVQVLSPTGEIIDLAARGSRPQLIHFWATWCAPCVPEIREFDEFTRTRADLSSLAIATDDEGWTRVGPFVKDRALSVAVALDPGGRVARTFGTHKYPETWLVAADGRILHQWLGPQDWTETVIGLQLDSLLGRSTQGR